MTEPLLGYCSFDEKFLENLVRDNPQHFFKEELVLDQQQPTLRGYRPDLIFRTEKNGLLIVEVQDKALDRNHLYKCIEYRDSLIDAAPDQAVRVALVCNLLQDRFKPLLNAHNIQAIVISPEDVWNVARGTIDGLNIGGNPHIRIDFRTMLRDLTKAPIDPVEDGPDLVTFWHFLTGDRFVESKAFLAPPAVKGRMEESKMKALKYGPVELFASLDGLCGIGQDHIEAIQEWLEVLSELTRPSNKDKQSLDVILGRRNEIYEAYVRGRIKRFSPLWNRYRCQGRYDFDKIQKDLTPFRGLAIYSGVHPALCPIPLAENIEIISGARSLCEAETKGSPISKAPVKRE